MNNHTPARLFRKMIRSTVLHHTVFWILSYYVLLKIFSLSSSIQKIDFIYTAVFIISLAAPVILNLYVFMPLFLRKGKYAYYLLSFLFLLFLFAWINQLVFSHFIDFIFPGYFFISFYTFADLLKFFLTFMGITTLLELSREWFELNAARHRFLVLEREKIDAELKALANQVNPHFLFNSLNVIYSLVINQRKESPEAILKLSDILRYVIYGSSAQYVSLTDEVGLIRNYIDLQRYRVADSSRITFDVKGSVSDWKIAPMLLLPLVENGFKHGIKGDVENTFLFIELIMNDDSLMFSVENNKGIKDDENGMTGPGVGLKNIRNRLDLIYMGKYKFDINENDKIFRVTMEIFK